MRVPLSWLREYVSLPTSVDVSDLVHRLDMSGTKVEEVHGLGSSISGVIVAEVLQISPHPDADNLTLVEVQRDGGDTQTVVCGARNFAPGDRVPLATVGSRLGELVITERKIRGTISRGMLCSGSELGVSHDHSGILVLPPDTPLGADVATVLGIGEPVLELEITPNRPDCMSIIGVAREVAALYRVDLEVPEPDLPLADLDDPIEVEIRDETGCPRYLARYMEEVSIGPSPLWLAARLLASGFRPISNVVDATNYALLETGQPLHAFDASKIDQRTIIVRRADAGETITTLDGEERKLDPEDLLIASPERPLAIAGVMGGLDSEVSDSTTSVVLESATFDKVSVSFTSRRLGLRSEASARFERGSDPEAVPIAAARAAQIIHETAGARVAGDATDAYPHPFERNVVRLRPSKTESLLGLQLPAEVQIEHLRSLQLDAALSRDIIEVRVPGFRRDLAIEADLVEEVARLEGFDRLPSTLPHGGAGRLTVAQRADRSIRRFLVGAGVTEAWTGSFSSPEDLDALGYPDDHPGRRMVELDNPMLENEPALRTTLLPGLMRSVALNHSTHRPSGIALFEVARIYQPSEEGLAEETDALGAVFSGDRRPQSWRREASAWDLFAVKGVLQATLTAVGSEDLSLAAMDAMPFHPTRGAAVLVAGQPIGALGEIHPDVCARFDVPEGAVALEVSMEAIIASLTDKRQTADLPRFPSAYIDLAFVVDGRVAAGAIRDMIAKAGGEEVVAVRLFDIYEGPQVPQGKKSLAFALEIRSPSKTLEERDVATVRDRIVSAIAERFGGELRA